MSTDDESSSLYRNEQAARGAVREAVPESVRDLSLDHKLLGCLAQEIKVTRGGGEGQSSLNTTPHV